MASAEEGNPQPCPGRETLTLPRHKGREQTSFILPPSPFPPPPPAISSWASSGGGGRGLRTKRRLITSLYPYRSLCAWFRSLLGKARKRGEKKSLCLCTNSHSEQERQAGGLGLPSGGGEVRPVDRICLDASAGHQPGVRTRALRFNCLKTHCHLPSTEGGVPSRAP